MTKTTPKALIRDTLRVRWSVGPIDWKIFVCIADGIYLLRALNRVLNLSSRYIHTL